MPEPTSCGAVPGGYCARVDALFNLPGIHVLDVGRRDDDQLVLTVELAPEPVGCAGCGVVPVGHGRRVRRLHDIPAFGAPVELAWRVRRWRCEEPRCRIGTFTDDGEAGRALSASRGKLTTRAAWWAISCIQRDTASVAAVARRLGVDWHTVWDAIKPLLAGLVEDPVRFEGVEILGVDEHIWHHAHDRGRAPRSRPGWST